MVSLDEAMELAARLPDSEASTSYGNRCWKVRGKQFAWVRPFSKADRKRFGSEPIPEGEIFALVTDGLVEKDAVLAAGHSGVFTIPHLDGYPALLVQLSAVELATLRDLIVDAWLSVAPAALAAEYLAQHPIDG